jgi:uncharacterized protein (TIGR01777 family)
MRVVITGATGLIGTALGAALERDGIEVTRLVRREPASATEVRWDPRTGAGGLDPAVLSGADGVVHLSGAPVAGGRWTESRKQVLRDSRVTSTTVLVAAMAAAPAPPPVLLSGSAIGWYGDTGDRVVDESAPAGSGFLATLVRDWEAAAAPASAAGVRVVNLRSGVVLSRQGGMLGPLLPLFKLGLGARFGGGDQYLSWIAATDWVRAARFLLGDGEIAGPVNLTAPEPVTNAEFTAALACAVSRPALLRVPGVLMRTALGELSSEILAGARVRPARLEQADFTFTYPAIGPALAAEVSSA